MTSLVTVGSFDTFRWAHNSYVDAFKIVQGTLNLLMPTDSANAGAERRPWKSLPGWTNNGRLFVHLPNRLLQPPLSEGIKQNAAMKSAYSYRSQTVN